MSDASRHDEIEDVLSSIRRLVADGPETTSPRRGRLVLTPALRVPEEEPGNSALAPSEGTEAPATEETAARPATAGEEDTAPPPAAEAAPGRASSLAERIAELEAVVAGYDDDEEEGAGSENTVPPAPGTPAWRAAVFPRAADAGARHTGRDEGGVAPVPADGQRDDGEPSDRAAPTAGPGDVVGEAPASAAGGAGADADAPPTETGGTTPEDESGRAPGDASGDDSGDDGAARAAADDAVANDATGTRERAAEADLLDEAVLREIVAEIVREELQGRLGERITRNVRKLVRQEVNRALASREFE